MLAFLALGTGTGLRKWVGLICYSSKHACAYPDLILHARYSQRAMKRLRSMYLVLLAFLSAALVSRADEAEKFKALATNASIRVEQTLNGLFHYYWRNDLYNKKIQFFFACGQIGGGTSGTDYGKCGCANPSSCISCFRWWDAVAMESVATYGIYRDTRNHSEVPGIIFAHSPYNADWNATATCTFIDDFSWYGIAYLRVYEWLQVCVSVCVHACVIL